MNNYSDRFDPNNYGTEEPVAVGLGNPSAPEEWWKGKEDDIAWVPERIFARAQAIASAYELHILPNINIYERTEINSKQAQTLMEELAFIKDVVNDALLEEWIQTIQTTIQKVLHCPKDIVVIIEGP